MSNFRLLVIDDQADICELIKEIGEECGYLTNSATTIDEFEQHYVDLNPTFIILDLQLGDSDGVELLRFLAADHCKAAIVLMSGADEKVLASAMRLGKTHGLNMVQSFQKPIQVATISQLLNKIKQAQDQPTPEQIITGMKENQFTIFHQPKIILATAQVVGVESLVRWQMPDKKIIYPDAFIGLTEKYNLITELTHIVANQAFHQCALWQQQKINLKVSVNLSAHSLVDLQLPDTLAAMAKDYGIEPHLIILEITETDVMSKPEVAMDILTRLRLKGFALSIDDFGTGYSSFTQLYRMPFNEIKIDKSFIINLENEVEARVISKSIIDLAHNLKLITTAEGIETSNNWDSLVDMGCDIGQGYYISRPLNIDDFTLWLKNNTDEHLKFIRPKK